MSENPTRRADVGSRRVHYLIQGHEGGRPVVLLHGAGFQGEAYEEVGSMTAVQDGTGYLAVIIDLPGYGRSSPAHLRNG